MPNGLALAWQSVQVVLMAMSPVSELRGSIFLAMVIYKMSAPQAFLLSVLGNMLPVLPLLLFLEPISNWLRRYRIFDRFFGWLFARTRRYSPKVERYGALALAPFVAIPLPVTGAWTACAIAFVFGIRARYAFPAIFAGVLGAGVIVTLSCMGVLVIAGV